MKIPYQLNDNHPRTVSVRLRNQMALSAWVETLRYESVAASVGCTYNAAVLLIAKLRKTDSSIPRKPTIAKAFDSQYEIDANGCWIWKRNKNEFGYGQFTVDGSKVAAHRYSWERSNGAIADGMWVLHKCDTPSCVNPLHLFLGTHADNMLDCRTKGRTAAGGRGRPTKLTASDVEIIRSLISDGLPHSLIANRFSVSRSTVTAINRGKSWKHIA